MVTGAIHRPSGRRVLEPALFPRFFAMGRLSSVRNAAAYHSEDQNPGMPRALQGCLLLGLQLSRHFCRAVPIHIEAPSGRAPAGAGWQGVGGRGQVGLCEK